MLSHSNTQYIKKKTCRITAWFLILFYILYAFSHADLLNISATGEDGEENALPSESINEKTRIISVIPYVEKNENGASQSVPVSSREDISANPNSTFLMIKLFINNEDAIKYYGNSLYIFKLKTNTQTTDLTELSPVANFIVQQNNSFEYNIPILTDLSLTNGEIFNKFVIATKTDSNEYIPVSTARYIDDINVLSNKKDVPPETISKKGLEVQMLGEAKLLGVEHTTIKIFLNDFMSAEGLPNTEKHTYGGEDFYFNMDKVSEYDRKIKPLTNDGINVTAILLLRSDKELRESKSQPETNNAEIADTGNTDGTDETDENSEANQVQKMSPQQYLIHPNALEELEAGGTASNAMFYGINTVTDDGVKYFSALMSFIADRYVKEDTGGGRINNIILGDEIGNSLIYNNCGKIELADYVRDYLKAVRICDTAIRSRYGGARVYIPFDNGFAAKSSNESEYVNKDIIDLLCEYSHEEGGFIWNIAFHAYNEDPSNPETWKETAPTNDYDTPGITLKNIEVLCDYINLEKKDFLPNSERRKIMLSEQGYSSGEGTNSEKDMELQAAAFVYGYLKVRYLPDITAFIYHRHVDGENEMQSYGLWTRATDTTSEPKKKKKIYDVFKYIDTNKEAEQIEFAKNILGIENFDELFPQYSEDSKYATNIQEAAVASVKKLSNVPISRFNQTDLSGFIATSNVEYLNIVKYSGESEKFKSHEKNLLVGFNRIFQGDYAGIFKSYPSDKTLDLSKNRYVGLTVRIDTAIESIKTIPLLLILEGELAPPTKEKNTNQTSDSSPVINSGVVQDDENSEAIAKSSYIGIFEGAANITPNEDTTIYFDIKDFKESAKINKIKLLINPYYSVNSGGSSADAYTGIAVGENGGDEISSSVDVAKYDFNLYVYNIVSANPAKLSLARILLNILIIAVILVITGYAALVIRARVITYKRRKRRAEQRRRRMQEQQRRRRQQPPR